LGAIKSLSQEALSNSFFPYHQIFRKKKKKGISPHQKIFLVIFLKINT